MRRLIEKGLMFGGLFHVDSPILVERYNRALEKLTGKRTALDDFHIDLGGFAPEIGDELGAPDYLNRDGCNRQFILLSVEQKRAPLLNMAFSHARPVLRDWIAANEAALFALTARDAVAGELTNSVFRIARPGDLLGIRKIGIDADTTGAHVADAAALTGLIEQFRTAPDAWLDDVLIARMIELARRTGDVTRVPVALRPPDATPLDFWTRHFGGAYIFRSVQTPFIAARDPAAFRDDPSVDLDVLAMDDAPGMARALHDNGLTQPLVGAPGLDAAPILRQKMGFVLLDAAAKSGTDLSGADVSDPRAVARRLPGALPKAFDGLAELLRYVEAGGAWPMISPEHPSYFYALRGQPGPRADLVNMLLAELAPLDALQLFICHKEAFYAAYRTWSDARRSLVADHLQTVYMSDKIAVRDALFGPNTPEPPPASRRKGPWG